MANKRTFWAIKQLALSKLGTTALADKISVHGLQSGGRSLNFNLEPVFEWGQLELYDNVENIPNVELTLEKFIDGYPLMYHLATNGSANPSLSGRQNVRTTADISFFADDQEAASGTPLAQCTMSGMYVSSLTYTFPVQGFCSESLTLVGNDSTWDTAAQFSYSGQFDGTDIPLALASGLGSVQQRQNVVFTYPGGVVTLDVNGAVDTDEATVLPQDIEGISSSGTNDRDVGGDFGAHIQSITVSVDLGREELFELGRRAPYHRFLNFPTEVTCAIECLTGRGDLTNATEEGTLGGGRNLNNRTIKIKLTEGTFINLGTKNKLQSVTLGGGDASGGNDSVTYNYSNYNILTVTHPQDPSGL